MIFEEGCKSESEADAARSIKDISDHATSHLCFGSIERHGMTASALNEKSIEAKYSPLSFGCVDLQLPAS